MKQHAQIEIEIQASPQSFDKTDHQATSSQGNDETHPFPAKKRHFVSPRVDSGKFSPFYQKVQIPRIRRHESNLIFKQKLKKQTFQSTHSFVANFAKLKHKLLDVQYLQPRNQAVNNRWNISASNFTKINFLIFSHKNIVQYHVIYCCPLQCPSTTFSLHVLVSTLETLSCRLK